jgi:hypothetical protein
MEKKIFEKIIIKYRKTMNFIRFFSHQMKTLDYKVIIQRIKFKIQIKLILSKNMNLKQSE